MTPAETLTTARAVWREIHRDGSDDPRGLALWYAEFCNLDAALFMAEIGQKQSLAIVGSMSIVGPLLTVGQYFRMAANQKHRFFVW